ncbi:hypothetical protein HYFRA_00001526 [Hymenoscyphus fraxineus]|uniref:GPI anchored serine-rich protein n=1 Tax=Hymenoscyphus fraxineus TaxID=746836 RepID=A0A9N9L7U5_9HELO|nr:hypothetical protein HYFRA_00001526 [Hymenoscyphus fraxineus]
MKASLVSALSVAAVVSAAGNDTMVTSTILLTKVATVTSCAPTVTNCPVGRVTSEIITTTTICPVSATYVPAPSTTPATTPAAGPVTQTFYNTKVYTITSCPPSVTNCPVGKVTSAVVTSTSVGPVPTSPACSGPGCPTPGNGNPGTPSGPACSGPGCPTPGNGNPGTPSGPACSGPGCPTPGNGNPGTPSGPGSEDDEDEDEDDHPHTENTKENNSGTPSGPGEMGNCGPAITSYITVTAGHLPSPVPAGPPSVGVQSAPAGCGGPGSPKCPVATGTPSYPSKAATCGGPGSPACPIYGTAAPSAGGPIGGFTNATSEIPFTGGAATQKATGLLMAVGIIAVLL